MTEMRVKERVERKLEKSGRITPREVLAAYRETGVTPTQGALMKRHEPSGDYRACGLGVLMLRDGIDPHGSVSTFLQKFPPLYHQGFANGFDGSEVRGRTPMPEWRKGYRDGQRARRFVFGV